MTPEQRRIAIAEACGARWHSVLMNPKEERLVLAFGQWINLGPSRWELSDGRILSPDIPDYLNNLNAMHEAERHMEQFETYVCHDYIQNLRIVIYPRNPNTVGIFRLLNATAAQRAEAFLRTLNLWKP